MAHYSTHKRTANETGCQEDFPVGESQMKAKFCGGSAAETIKEQT